MHAMYIKYNVKKQNMGNLFVTTLLSFISYQPTRHVIVQPVDSRDKEVT